MDMKEKSQYIEQYIRNITKSNPDIFTNEIIQKAIDAFKESDESLEILIPKINAVAKKILENSIKPKKKLQEMEEKFKGKDYQATNIDNLDISLLSYSQMESLLFHYAWKKYLESYDKNGMKPAIGENSEGIDREASIFFSKGVEGVLELWDVWLKWRLNRLENPQYNGNTKEEIQETFKRFKLGQITAEEQKKWDYWIEYFINKKYLENDSMLINLFEYQYTEMIDSDYLVLDLKENEEYKIDQNDIKKEIAIKNENKLGFDPLLIKAQYGAYSDFSTLIADKWNMQTIPGKNIVIEPRRIKRLNVNGKTDVYSIMKFMYDKYKKEIPEEKQVKFDVLDRYVDYVEKKLEELETLDLIVPEIIEIKEDKNIFQNSEKKDEKVSEKKNDVFRKTITSQQINTQTENKPQPVQQQISSTPKKSESFSQRSQSEIQVYQQIKEKNSAIQKYKNRKNNKKN